MELQPLSSIAPPLVTDVRIAREMRNEPSLFQEQADATCNERIFTGKDIIRIDRKYKFQYAVRRLFDALR